jgi:hypothetical protein
MIRTGPAKRRGSLAFSSKTLLSTCLQLGRHMSVLLQTEKITALLRDISGYRRNEGKKGGFLGGKVRERVIKKIQI